MRYFRLGKLYLPLDSSVIESCWMSDCSLEVMKERWS